MKTQTLNILGRRYNVQTNLDSEDIEKIATDLERRVKILDIEYPSLDRLDIFVLCIIEAYEARILMEKRQKKDSAVLDKAFQKVSLLEEKVEKELNNLTK